MIKLNFLFETNFSKALNTKIEGIVGKKGKYYAF